MNTNATNMKKMITWPITIKLLKISDKKKSKIATEKKKIHYIQKNKRRTAGCHWKQCKGEDNKATFALNARVNCILNNKIILHIKTKNRLK